LAQVLTPALAPPTDAARDVMRLSLMDWMACGLAGQDEPVAKLTRALVRDEGGAAQATLFGGGKLPARGVALANGACSHALDYDDTHFAHIGHPSVAVLSAAYAMAEREGADLEQMLDAALAGCEASVRFGILFGRGHYQQGFHQTGTAGAFGAGVAAGILLGLTPAQLGQAMGLVSTRASGLKSQFGTMGKPYNAGIAAANGVEAALLAAKGFVSDPGALWGQNGYLETHHCDGEIDETPGFLMEQVSHKFHVCCHGLHATLEALELLKPLDIRQILSVQITTHPRWMTVCNQPAPKTGLEAKFSYRMVAALSLTGHATAALSSYSDALCADPEVIALRDRVQVRADAELSETEAIVRIETSTGAYEAHHDLNAPMPLQTRRARIHAKVAALLGEKRADALCRAARGTLEQLTVSLADEIPQ
jgi:2-methylcitrate dehydratase PrpD